MEKEVVLANREQDVEKTEAHLQSRSILAGKAMY